MFSLLLVAAAHQLSFVHPSSVFPPVITADAFTALGTQLTTILTEVLTIFKTIAPIVGGLGLLAIGMMYLGAPLPVISGWKNNNPQMFSNVTIGIAVLFSVGLITNIIPTS